LQGNFAIVSFTFSSTCDTISLSGKCDFFARILKNGGKTHMKKILSILLAVVMVIGMLPLSAIGALAADETTGFAISFVEKH
jgi:hypothetical protein